MLEKDPPLTLPARVTAALEEARCIASPSGLDATLQLARPMRAEVQQPAPLLTVADINAGLLAYRRYGDPVIGRSAGAAARLRAI